VPVIKKINRFFLSLRRKLSNGVTVQLISVRLRTLFSLGLHNVWKVISYRIGVYYLGINPVCRLQVRLPDGPFFKKPTITSVGTPSSAWKEKACCFGYILKELHDGPPDWLANPFTGIRITNAHLPWWQIPDFDSQLGDIKAVWEASRFDWVLGMAQRTVCGVSDEMPRLNNWIADWCRVNPAYFGHNWKCGQEASIRVMHLAMVALILDQVRFPESALLDLVKAHLQRILPTLGYAMAQDNNHGISEAAALFIGGSWMHMAGVTEGRHWKDSGRYWLENRAARLIENDGSFSQYSLNYHRLMLDTCSMVELWRQHLDLPDFSMLWQSKVAAAARWLAAMVDPVSGDAPNLGANDGARLLALTDTDYRDFRPSVQLAMVLFTGQKAYASDGSWNGPLIWFRVALPSGMAESSLSLSQLFDDGGYAVLRYDAAMALLRYPRFKFRPSHADALHVDFWRSGENLLRDGGSYSYSTEPEWINYFPGTISHNTVQFDDRDQMPRLGRFLFGDWLKTEKRVQFIDNATETSFCASYRDRQGACHSRRVRLTAERLQVEDVIHGFTDKAVLRWRVRPGNWQLTGQRLTDGEYVLSVTGDMPIIRIELVTGWESRYYLQKNALPVLEVEVHEHGVLMTDFCWPI
jgi:hypothetical protein